jgi:cytoskeletal protein CcmA (bactofilin family)
MSIWKDNTASKQIPTPPFPGAKESLRLDAASMPEVARPAAASVARVDAAPPSAESVVAADITIEGKIEGGGSVRIAGKFKGDVSIQGDLTIEAGAKLTGRVRAAKVTIAGELEGNIDEASHVDLRPTGAMTGDLKAGSLTVAAGARMRGQAEFGVDDGKGSRAGNRSNHLHGGESDADS